MRIKLDTGDIEAFAAVGRGLSFTAAADLLNISPSALSRRVQKLEEQLDMRLLDRTTRAVKLTLPGKRFLERSQEILTDVDELVMAVKGESAGRPLSITVAAIPSIAHKILPAPLRLFNERHPATRVRVKDVTTNDVVDAVARGEAAFGITSFVSAESNLVFTSLFQGEFVLVAPRGHVLGRRRRVRWSEIAAHRVISTWKGAGVRLVLDFDLAKAGDRLDAFYEVQQIYTVLKLVEAGLGVAAVPNYFLGAAERESLHVVPLVDPTISVDLGTVTSSHHPLRGPAQDLYDLLRLSAGSVV